MSAVAGPSRHALDTDHAETELLRSTLAVLSSADAAGLEFRQGREYLSDREVALRFAHEEVSTFQRHTADRALAEQLQAEETGGQPLRLGGNGNRQIVQTPQPANPVRAVVTLAADANAAGIVPQQKSGVWNAITSFVSWLVSSPYEPATPRPTPVVPTAPVRPPPRPPGQKCVVCQENINGHYVRAPCGHYYDKDCVQELFQAATKDESLFPPRCCRQTITLDSIRAMMPEDVLKLFEEKSVEFSTLKRVYCSNPRCSRFVCPQKTNTSWFSSPAAVLCPDPACKTRTCSSCKGEVKSGVYHACQPDRQAVDVLALGRQEGWQRCPGCEQLIELNMGCYHMTCRCRTEFCYVCRARWKSCRCPQWDENRLLRAAEARVNARFGIVPDPPAPRPVVPQVIRQAPPPAVRQAVIPTSREAVSRRDTIRSWAQVAAPVHARVDSPSVLRKPPRPTSVASSSTAASGSTGSRASTSTTLPSYWDVINTASPASLNTSGSSRWDPDGGFHSSNRNGVAALPASRQTRQTKGKGVLKKPRPTHDRDRLIREAMDELRVNHDCSHDHWYYVRGAGRCENCRDHLPIYLYRCHGCEMFACNRCRRNRL